MSNAKIEACGWSAGSYPGHGDRRTFKRLPDPQAELLCQCLRLYVGLDGYFYGDSGRRTGDPASLCPAGQTQGARSGPGSAFFDLPSGSAWRRRESREVVFCIGYMADTVEETLGDRYQAIRLIYSREDEPLGTGGALRQALPLFPSDPVLVMNGDSFMDVDLAGYLRWFLERKREVSLVLARVPDTGRFRAGHDRRKRNEFGASKRKGRIRDPGWINAGIYLLQKENPSISSPGGKAFSLERELFPCLLGGRLYGYRSEGRFIDIGTPESYATAEGFFAGEKYGNTMNPNGLNMYAPKRPDANTRVKAGVGVIVVDAAGRILLERRSDNGMWGLPGGAIEAGESVQPGGSARSPGRDRAANPYYRPARCLFRTARANRDLPGQRRCSPSGGYCAHGGNRLREADREPARAWI